MTTTSMTNAEVCALSIALNHAATALRTRKAAAEATDDVPGILIAEIAAHALMTQLRAERAPAFAASRADAAATVEYPVAISTGLLVMAGRLGMTQWTPGDDAQAVAQWTTADSLLTELEAA